MEVDVSIVIVCMNNLTNLYPCLKSIRKYTREVIYETFVVAYFFSNENLKKVKADFPWVTIIESNEIRGFSENNNLALQQARGKYCFVLNDDTEMEMPVIDHLYKSIEALPENVAAISPVAFFGDRTIQSCGRPRHTFFKEVLRVMKIWNEQTFPSKYTHKNGVFQTYDLWGAYFLIKTDVFKKMNWFDEYYFFSPEDIDLSRKLNRNGYKCYVDADVSLIHYEGMTGRGVSKLQLCTKPAAFKGGLNYYADNSIIRLATVSLISFFLLIPQFFYHVLMSWFSDYSRNNILAKADLNSMIVCFSRATPKQIFIKFYSRLGDRQDMYMPDIEN